MASTFCVVQLLALKGKESSSIENRPINLNKESTHHEGSWSNGSDNSCDHVNTAGIFHHPPTQNRFFVTLYVDK